VALQYHFKDREGMVRAVMARHNPVVERHRDQLLDLYQQGQGVDIRELSAALVLPSAAKLSDPDGGIEYLKISAELVDRAGIGTFDAGGSLGASINRWRTLVEPFLNQDATRLHRRFTAIRFSAMELGRRAESAPHRDDRLFTSQLVDLVTALLLAPVSTQTAELAASRPRRRGRSTP
jgi:AcrR family transcriptional regulator